MSGILQKRPKDPNMLPKVPTRVGDSVVSKTCFTLTLRKRYAQKTCGYGTELYQSVTSPHSVITLTNNGSIIYGLLHGFYAFKFPLWPWFTFLISYPLKILDLLIDDIATLPTSCDSLFSKDF